MLWDLGMIWVKQISTLRVFQEIYKKKTSACATWKITNKTHNIQLPHTVFPEKIYLYIYIYIYIISLVYVSIIVSYRGHR